MSVLINELEARKDNYILVLDVLNLMADATSSSISEVIKYLDAHNIDEHLNIFYMDESYNFEPYNGFLIGLGSDANRTYFQKSAVLAFEPITKHGLFKDDLIASKAIDDIYGRTHDANQHKKNREDDYLTLDESLLLLNNNTDVNAPSYDYKKLRDLARKRLITPCFYFSGYIGSFRGGNEDSLHTEIVTAYFTYRSLTEEICCYDDYMKLPACGVQIYRILEKQTVEYVDLDDGVFLLYEKANGFKNAEKETLSHYETDEIRFSKRELDSYIASLAPAANTQYERAYQSDNELIKQLESLRSENNDLNARLCTARNTYKQHAKEIKSLKEKIEQGNNFNSELNEQLGTAKAELVDSQIDSIPPSNLVIHNIKQEAIKHFNRSLATVLIDLDYRRDLRKGDIVNFIIPYMKELAFMLADEDREKADNLTVSYNTLYDTHLQGLEFKKGAQSKKDKERANIELLFKKQLPITE